MFYRPDGKAACADVIPYYEDGCFYLFYLRDLREPERLGEGCPWCLLTSRDLVHFTDHGEVLPRGTQEEQDLYVFTGSCSKFNGEYYIFYTGHNHHLMEKGRAMQKILLAKSKDLLHWHKVSDFVLEAPEWLEMHDYRDPYVYYDTEAARYHMLITGRIRGDLPEHSKGMTLLLTSEDLYHWELQREPFYAPNAYYTHECPDLFQMGDWWYLVFSENTDKLVTTYRMAKSPKGPWLTPKVDAFDGHAFYAAKSASDGKHRYLFGWNCTKEGEKDDGVWQWGGNIVVHELVQAHDGSLFVRCPEAVRNVCNVPVPFEETFRIGTVKSEKNRFTVGTNSGKSMLILGQLPSVCRLEMEFTTMDEIGDFGLLLRTDMRGNQHYAVKFDPKYNRLAFDKFPRCDATIHIHADTERYCPIVPGEKNRLTVLVQESVLVVYVNDRVAMNARMYDYLSGGWALYTHNTCVSFEQIQLSVPQTIECI